MRKNRLHRIFNRLLTLGLRKKLLSPQHAVDNHAADNQSEHEEVIPTFIVKGASMSRIDDMEDKQFWERKYTKDVLKALKKKSGIILSKEYEEKLEKLDEIRPDDDVSLPSVSGAKYNEEELLSKLCLYFREEEMAKRFLNSVKNMNDKEIIARVKKDKNANICTDTSKSLWRVLHDAHIYKATYANWNKQLNKEIFE